MGILSRHVEDGKSSGFTPDTLSVRTSIAEPGTPSLFCALPTGGQCSPTPHGRQGGLEIVYNRLKYRVFESTTGRPRWCARCSTGTINFSAAPAPSSSTRRTATNQPTNQPTNRPTDIYVYFGVQLRIMTAQEAGLWPCASCGSL